MLEEYKKLVGECGYARREITEARKAKRREVMHYILNHDKEFTPSDLFRLCNCENYYHSPSSLSCAIQYEWLAHHHNTIDWKARTVTRKYVEVDDNGHIIPDSTFSRTVKTHAYQVKQEK